MENRKAVLHLYDSASRDIYEAYVMRLCEYVVTTYIDTVSESVPLSEKERTIVVRFFKCELYGLISEWIANGMPDSALDDAAQIAALTRTFITLIRAEKAEPQPK